MAYASGSIFRKKGSDIWHIQWYQDGFAKQKSSRSTVRKVAERMLADELHKVRIGKARRGQAPTVSQALDMLLADYKERNLRSARITELRVNRHLRPKLGAVAADQLAGKIIKTYISDRKKQEAKPATINRELAALRRALTLCHEAEMLPNPPHIPQLEENNVREGFLELEGYEAIRKMLPHYLVPLLVVGFHCGGRKSELLSIELADVDLHAKEIRLWIDATKTKRARTIPIYGDMVPILEMHIDQTKKQYPECRSLFHHNGKPIKDFREAWITACKAAGHPGLHFHDLRRSAVRNLERAGVPRSIAMSITGHTTESTYRRYDITSSKDLRLAAEKLEHRLAAERADLAKRQESKPAAAAKRVS